MTRVTSQISVSLDGFAAGPDQSLEHPLGTGGERLHGWFFGPEAERHPADREIGEHLLEGNGAYVMGRRMFGGGDGSWDPAWRGWWGEEPPYHAPVFVLTHHPREPLAMAGGTTFTFVTDGFDAAFAQARAAAGARDVCVAGGASVVQQALRAGVLDELHLHVVPTLLGAGERLLEDVGDPVLEPVAVVATPAATHVRYRVGR
jgi:dihydrofolate reductase